VENYKLNYKYGVVAALKLTEYEVLDLIEFLSGSIKLDSNSSLYVKLLNYYVSDIPYGYHTGDDGTIEEWLHETLEHDVGNLYAKSTEIKAEFND